MVTSISRIMSIPTELFTVAVIYEVGSTLRTNVVHSSIWDANVNDDNPRGLYDGMEGRLREGFSKGEGESSMYQQPI